MAKMLEEENAQGIAKDTFSEIKEEFGMVPNFFKALAAHDPHWLAMNWEREKAIMIEDSSLDRQTKEIIAMVVSMVNNCEYCSMAHEGMAKMVGVSNDQINDAKKIIELFSSFNTIANTLKVPCDIDPDTIN